jgi:rhodanese-related sulfurtransferase
VGEQQRAGGGPTIVDVRSEDEYLAGHVAGARHIPIDQLADRLGEIPADHPVVTYCMMRHRGDSRGERAAALLREQGYDARALDGGLPAWEAAGLPVERGGDTA